MQNAWIGIFCAALLSTAACAELDAPEGTSLSAAANTQDVASDSDVANSDSDSLGYGWTMKIAATKSNGFKEDFSISDIVTNSTVKIRKDNIACTGCHSWASYADRQSFCDRVDAFVAEPTANYDGSDAPSAKPKSLKTILSKWKAAGCPD